MAGNWDAREEKGERNPRIEPSDPCDPFARNKPNTSSVNLFETLQNVIIDSAALIDTVD